MLCPSFCTTLVQYIALRFLIIYRLVICTFYFLLYHKVYAILLTIEEHIGFMPFQICHIYKLDKYDRSKEIKKPTRLHAGQCNQYYNFILSVKTRMKKPPFFHLLVLIPALISKF